MAPSPSDKEVKSEDSRRDNVRYWHKWIKRARKASERHWQDSDEAWAEYENGKQASEHSYESKPERCYPKYFSACKHTESAFYSRDPKTKARRRFDIDDEGALTQQLIVERLGEYFIETSHFGEAMAASRDNFIHADKAANQLIFDYDLEPGAMPSEEDVYDDTQEQSEDPGLYGETNAEPKAVNKKIRVQALQYDETLHTADAKTQSEITDIAIHFCLDKEEGDKRFPHIKNLPYRSSKSSRREDDFEYSEQDELKSVGSERYVCGWEIYCTHTNMVYWVSEDYGEDFLDKKPLPEVSRFRGKFPCTKFIINSKPRKHMFPTPVFKQLEPTTHQLHKQYAQLMESIEAARPRNLVFADDDDLVAALEILGRNRFIKVKNGMDLLSKGDMRTLVQEVPVDGIVAAMSQLVSLEETFNRVFDEAFGTPEILRGVSEGEKTKAEVEIEQGSANDRFRFSKKQIENLARETLEMGIDLILDEFTDEEIAQICGWQYMERGEIDPQTGQIISLGHYERFFDALNQLRNDQERLVRIDIETDSTSFTNEMREMQKRKSVNEVLLQGLSVIGGMQNIQFMPVVTRALMSVLEAAGGSVVSEDGLKEAIKELEEVRNQPPPEPPPDFTMMKAQLSLQGKQLEVSARQQKDAFDAQATQRELDQAEYRIALDERKQTLEGQISVMQTQLDQTLVTIEQQRLVLEAQNQSLEEFKAKMAADEARLEEMRLAIETSRGDSESSENLPAVREPQAQPPSIVVVDANRPSGKRLARVARDMNGDISAVQFESIADE